MSRKPHLIVTWSLDKIGELTESIAAKLLVSSLVRSFVNCQVLVYRRGESPIFLVDRLGVIELDLDGAEPEEFAPLEPYRGGVSPCPWDLFVTDQIDLEPFDKVLFLSPHCLALRSIDHLLAGDWDVGWQALPGVSSDDPVLEGMMSGRYSDEFEDSVRLATPNFVAIRASFLNDALMEWREIHEAMTAEYVKKPVYRLAEDDEEEVLEWKATHTFFESWNRFLLRTEAKRCRIETGEIRFPLWLDPRFADYAEAALLAPDGGSANLRRKLFYSLYMGTFFDDPEASFLQFLEM